MPPPLWPAHERTGGAISSYSVLLMRQWLFFSLRPDLVFLWGTVATILLTILLEGSRALGISRMSFTFLLGTVFAANRDHAEVIGFACHFLIGWLFAFFYALIFASLHYRSWWLGLTIGFFHALFLNLAVLPVLPYIHPRMGNEYHGPTPTRMLEPPGILGLNYGRRTPETSFAAHLLFGLILGSLLGT